MGESSKVVFGVAVGTAFARSAVCSATLGGQSDEAIFSSSSINRPEIVVNADGDRGTPCIVARRGEGAEEEWLVGEAAKSAMAGRDWANVKAWPGQVLIKAFKGEKQEESGGGGDDGGEDNVGDVCTRMLQQVLEQAENFSGESLSDCVLAVPSSLSEEERAAMIHTANMSGFSVKGVIREPVAAALAYYVTSGEPPGKAGRDVSKVMVCDLGHSHFDISILEEQKGVLSYVYGKTVGDGVVGGKAVAEKLVGLCLAEFLRKCGCDAQESRRAMTKLWRECENGVKVLSMSQQAEIEIDSLHEGYDLRMRVTRARFEGECFDIFRQCVTAVEAAIQEADLVKDEIDLLLLAGGMSRIPKMQSMIAGLFPESTSVKMADVNPEEAVAIGAAVQAQMLTQTGASGGRGVGNGGIDSHAAVSRPLPISPLTFGVQLQGGGGGAQEGGGTEAFVLFNKGDFLPAEQAFLVQKTSSGQDTIRIPIVASSDPAPLVVVGNDSNLVVAEPAFKIPKDLPKDTQMRVDICLSVDGSLHVTLQSADAGSAGSSSLPKQEITIVPNKAPE